MKRISTHIVDLVLGKASFSEQQLLENYVAALDEVVRLKPSAAKGRYVRGITVSSTMGPGVRIDPARLKPGDEEELAVPA